VRIVWLRAAERNLEEQLDYIGERNPRAANTLAEKIAAAVARLPDHPRRGRPGRVTGTRELAVPGTPYIVVYMVGADYVRIHRVLHGAQRWPPHSW
jgi:toxin ParE1/3/4